MIITWNIEVFGPSTAPEITQAASFPFEPIVNQPLQIDPASATGTPDPSVTYEMQRGGSVIENVDDLEFDGLVAGDIGTSLSVLVTASNGVSPDATEVTQTAPVVYSEDIDWSAYTIGDSGADITDWTIAASMTIASDAASPTGRAAVIKPNVSNPTVTYFDPWTQDVASASSIEYVEAFYVFKLNDVQSRYGFMMLGASQVGLYFYGSQKKHYIRAIEGDFDAPNVSATNTGVGEVLVLRHRIQGDVSTFWLWNINDPEPAEDDFTSSRSMGGTDMEASRPGFFGRLTSAADGNDLYYLSYGINAPAPRDSRILIIPPEPSDVMQYEAPAEQGATSVTDIDGGTMTITVEDV